MSEMIAAPQQALATAEPSIGSTIQWAMQNGATVEQMRELYAFQREVKADQAREAFNRAFADFKANAIRIVKGTDVKAGPLSGSKYANLYDVVKAVTPSLSEHQLSHAWKLTKDEPGWMEVTCTISHAQGHSESVSMGAAPDKGPGRNDIQARGSAKTYLERYTLLAATGLTASDSDDDGNGGKEQKPRMAEADLVMRIEHIRASETPGDVENFYNKGMEAAEKLEDRESAKTIMAEKKRRLRELREAQ